MMTRNAPTRIPGDVWQALDAYDQFGPHDVPVSPFVVGYLDALFGRRVTSTSDGNMSGYNAGWERGRLVKQQEEARQFREDEVTRAYRAFQEQTSLGSVFSLWIAGFIDGARGSTEESDHADYLLGYQAAGRRG